MKTVTPKKAIVVDMPDEIYVEAVRIGFNTILYRAGLIPPRYPLPSLIYGGIPCPTK